MLFIYDNVSIMVSLGAAIITFFMVDQLKIEKIDTTVKKLIVSVLVGVIFGIGYCAFVSSGTEKLLTDDYSVAASKFGSAADNLAFGSLQSDL